jgi:type I site-specific restriction endonuclease
MKPSKIYENTKPYILVSSAAIMSTGVNIPSIRNIVFAIPVKSSIRVRQSIGRGLRLDDGKEYCDLYDISDDLKYKKYTNTTMNHFEDRIKIYEKEQFDFTIKTLKLS